MVTIRTKVKETENWLSKLRIHLDIIPTRIKIATPRISRINNGGRHLEMVENPLAFACREPR